MDHVNELMQASLDVRNELEGLRKERRAVVEAYSATLTKQSRGHGGKDQADALQAKLETLDARIAAADRRWIECEGEYLRERQRLDAETAAAVDIPGGGILGPSGASTSASSVAGSVGKTYAQLFGQPTSIRAEGWENGAGDFFGALARGLHHPALRPSASSFQNEGVGSEGGYLIPEEITARALDGAMEDEPILRQVTLEPMRSETKRVSGYSTKNHSTGNPFGFSGGWLGEGGSMTAGKGTLRSILLSAKKLGLLVQASNEVASDGMGFERQLEDAMRKAMAWLLADAVFVGTGAGQPMGVLNGPCVVEVAKEGGQAATTLTYENVVKMLSRLLPSVMGRATFFASHTVRPQLMALSVAVGTGGSFIPLQLGADGIYRLLGVKLFWTEHLPTLGTAGDLVLGDFSQYILGLRQQVTLDRSAHVGFTSDLQTYRGIMRADGQPKFDAVFTPKNGSSMGPFVTVAAR